VIAARDEVDARSEHFIGGLRRQAEAAGGVFAVRYTEIDVILIAYERNAPLEGIAAR
jgi:hypothetical protein